MKIIITVILFLIAYIWGSISAYKYKKIPRTVERIVEIKVNDVYYNDVKVNGE